MVSITCSAANRRAAISIRCAAVTTRQGSEPRLTTISPTPKPWLRARQGFDLLVAPERLLVIKGSAGRCPPGAGWRCRPLWRSPCLARGGGGSCCQRQFWPRACAAASPSSRRWREGGRQYGQADAAHVDKIALAQGGENGLALGLRQPVAGGGVAAPVGERALAVGRGVDEIETGGLVSQALHPVGVDALLLPGGQHLAAEPVLAEGRDVVHRERLATQAGEIEAVLRVSPRNLVPAGLARLGAAPPCIRR